MAEIKRVTINRFDGGITSDLYNMDNPSKCAHVSHFNIYKDPNLLVPMPDYVADTTYNASGTGLKTYNVKAFTYDTVDGVVAVGTKSDGTGSSLFYKTDPEGASWSKFTHEGSYNLRDRTFLANVGGGDYYFYTTTNGGSTYFTAHQPGVGVTDATGVSMAGTSTTPLVAYKAVDAEWYANGIISNADFNNLKTDGTSVTDTFDSKVIPNDFTNLNDLTWYVGVDTEVVRSYLEAWDTASSNPVYKFDLGTGIPRVVESSDGILFVVIDDYMTTDLSYSSDLIRDKGQLRIVYTEGSTIKEFISLSAESSSNAVIVPYRAKYQNRILFYAKIPTNSAGTTFKQGIWALGRRDSSSPIALSLLLDTSSLGLIEGYSAFGNHHFFAHNEDGSVSRLSDSTFSTETSVYESLVFDNDTARSKSLRGAVLKHQPLDDDQTVTIKFRTSLDDSWTTLKSNSTNGATRTVAPRSHQVLGDYEMIQWRIESTGGSAGIRSLSFDYEILNDLAY